MNAQDKINKIIETIEAGRTVYITTATRSTKIDNKCLNRFRNAGHILLKAVDNSIYLASGKNFVCID